MTVPAAQDPSLPTGPSRRGSNIVFYLGAVLLVAGIGVVLSFLFGPERFDEGDCINYAPTRMFDFDPEFEGVDCSDPAAKSVILKVLDDPASGDAKRVCEPLPGYTGYVSVQRGDSTKTLCLAKK